MLELGRKKPEQQAVSRISKITRAVDTFVNDLKVKLHTVWGFTLNSKEIKFRC